MTKARVSAATGRDGLKEIFMCGPLYWESVTSENTHRKHLMQRQSVFPIMNTPRISRIPPFAIAAKAKQCDRLRFGRSEEHSVGTECVSTCRSRWSPDH